MSTKDFIESISLEGEIWRDVVGFENCYIVSSFGRVASKERYVATYFGKRKVTGKLLKLKISKTTGYYCVCLRNNGAKKYPSVHRLVAEAFIPNPSNKPQVDHIDRNKQNNSVENLRWCTGSENMLNPLTRPILSRINKGRKRPYAYHPVVGLKNGIVIYRFQRLMECEEYGFNYSQVSSCCTGRNKTHKGISFMYLSDYEKLLPIKDAILAPKL